MYIANIKCYSNNMRIAVLTQPLHRNYGGLLQAYALQTYLEKMGHEVVIVNRNYGGRIRLYIFLRRLGSLLRSLIYRVLLGRKEYIFMNPLSSNYHSKWNGYDVLPFVGKYMKQSQLIKDSRQLNKYFAKEHFDCFIVGSDQVWRPRYSPCITDYFLKEIPADTKALKIAYAASFGTSDWEFSEEDTLVCARLAKLFDKISVREKSGVRLCEEYLGVQAEHVLDPTLLLDAEDYIRLFEDAKVPKSEANLFCYVLDANAESESIISSLEHDGYKATHAKLVTNPTRENPRPGQLSVEEWLRGIYDAELVVTDSFHACVFSIIFKKPFIALGNKTRGNTRFDSLFDTFGLQDRLVESHESFMENKESLVNMSGAENNGLFYQLQREKSAHFLMFI